MSIKDNVTVALFVSRRLHGAHRVKTNLDKLIISYARTIKVKLRLAKLGNGLALNRDVIGVISIGLKYLTSNGSSMELGSVEPREVRVKLVNLHRGQTSLTGL